MPAHSSRLLLDEYPLIVLPTLACVFGDRDAIFLQQIHYWTEIYRRQNNLRHYHAGRWWVYNPVETDNPRQSSWSSQFPFWSAPTIKRIIQRNTKRGTLLTANYNLAGYDRTMWYTLDYERITDRIDAWERKNALCPRPLDQNDLIHQLKLIPCMGSERSDPSDQNDPIHEISLIPPIPETTRDQLHETSQIWTICLDELAMILPHTYHTPLQNANLLLDDHQATIITDQPEQLAAWTQTQVTRTLSSILGYPITLSYKKEIP